jgi:hypothetical protein
MRQQPALALQAAAVSRQGTILAHHAVAWNRDCNRIGTASPGHRSSRFGFTDSLGDFRIAAGAVSGYLVYRMVSPSHSHSEIDLQHFPGHPVLLNFAANGGPQRPSRCAF